MTMSDKHFLPLLQSFCNNDCTSHQANKAYSMYMEAHKNSRRQQIGLLNKYSKTAKKKL